MGPGGCAARRYGLAVGLGGIARQYRASRCKRSGWPTATALAAMSRFFGHVLALPLSFHGDTHSGRLMKMMISGSDALFALWLTFFREQLSTYIAVLVLLPLTCLLNWRLALALIVLVVVYLRRHRRSSSADRGGQRRVEAFNSNLAGTRAGRAGQRDRGAVLHPAARPRRRLFGEIAAQVIAHQFPVLNWWAVVNVLTRGASTIAVISIVVIGTAAAPQRQGRASARSSPSWASPPC